MSVASVDFPQWFGRLIDPDVPPTTMKQCLERYEKKRMCDGNTPPSSDADLFDVAHALQLYHTAMCNTPGMSEFLERWFVWRAMGAKCPSERVLFLPRESGCYATAMPSATDEENAMLATYDEQLAMRLDAEVGVNVLIAGICVAYWLPLAGLESQFTRRLTERLDSMPDHGARRAALAMTECAEFESAEIAEMTRISVGEAQQQQQQQPTNETT